MVSTSAGEADAPFATILSTSAFHPGPSMRMAEIRSSEWHSLHTIVAISLPGPSGNCARMQGGAIRLHKIDAAANLSIFTLQILDWSYVRTPSRGTKTKMWGGL